MSIFRGGSTLLGVKQDFLIMLCVFTLTGRFCESSSASLYLFFSSGFFSSEASLEKEEFLGQGKSLRRLARQQLAVGPHLGTHAHTARTERAQQRRVQDVTAQPTTQYQVVKRGADSGADWWRELTFRC